MYNFNQCFLVKVCNSTWGEKTVGKILSYANYLSGKKKKQSEELSWEQGELNDIILFGHN